MLETFWFWNRSEVTQMDWRYGFDIPVSVQKIKRPLLALVHCPSVTFDVYQPAVALFGEFTRGWVWKGVFGAGGIGYSAFDGTHTGEFLSVFARTHLVDTQRCFGVHQREGGRIEQEI